MEIFWTSLGLTLLIEVPIAFLWGLRGRALAVVLLANILTNPLAVALHRFAGLPQFPIEMAVVLGEGMIYRSFSRTPGWRLPKPVLLAAVSNAVSWGLGLLISPG